jgi:hypothetical protein
MDTLKRLSEETFDKLHTMYWSIHTLPPSVDNRAGEERRDRRLSLHTSVCLGGTPPE